MEFPRNPARLALSELNTAASTDLLTRTLSPDSFQPISCPVHEDDFGDEIVGKGQCGTVYAMRGTGKVAKIANSNLTGGRLLNDNVIHRRVLKALSDTDAATKRGINVPEIRGMWHITDIPDDRLKGVVGSWITAAWLPDLCWYALVTDRIRPVPRDVQACLVAVLCPPGLRRLAFLNRHRNKSCLIRIYLGRRDCNDERQKRSFSDMGLRNFPLHINEMERLRINTGVFASTMARALAIMHWKAGIDGNHVEFVLGGSPPDQRAGASSSSPPCDPAPSEQAPVGESSDAAASKSPDHEMRSLALWLIDFDQCAAFEHDEAGLKKIVDAFICNDPYYPRPGPAGTSQQAVWEIFRGHYLQTSSKFTQSNMPNRFIAAIETRCAESPGDVYWPRMLINTDGPVVQEVARRRAMGACLDPLYLPLDGLQIT